MEIGETLYVTKRPEWRAWLRKNHRTAADIWLVAPRKATGKPRLPYNDAVEEALCFGWIDSIIKKIDDDHAAQRYSPRRPRSPYSQTNKERIARMVEAGLVADGVLPPWEEIDPGRYRFPADIMAELRADRKAYAFFRSTSPSYQRIRISYIDAARDRPEDFAKRLESFLAKTRAGKQFGHDIESFY